MPSNFNLQEANINIAGQRLENVDANVDENVAVENVAENQQGNVGLVGIQATVFSEIGTTVLGFALDFLPHTIAARIELDPKETRADLCEFFSTSAATNSTLSSSAFPSLNMPHSTTSTSLSSHPMVIRSQVGVKPDPKYALAI